MTEPLRLLVYVIVAAIIWMIAYYLSSKAPMPSEIRWLLLLLLAVLETVYLLNAFGVF